VYTSQLARSQIELYQQQLYSDVDYVIYPLQDPAVSQQEYLDSKQGSILAAMAQTQPPPYLAYHTIRAHNRSWDGNHALYRSTPFLSMAISSPSRYASTQNLSDTYVQLPGTYSPIYSPSVTSLCSSYEPPPPVPPLRRIAQSSTIPSASIFSRSRSDDNILNSIDIMPKSRRPIPIPPAYDKKPIRKPPMPAPVENCTSKCDDVTAPPTGRFLKLNTLTYVDYFYFYFSASETIDTEIFIRFIEHEVAIEDVRKGFTGELLHHYHHYNSKAPRLEALACDLSRIE
jgi:hypothetical protein